MNKKIKVIFIGIGCLSFIAYISFFYSHCFEAKFIFWADEIKKQFYNPFLYIPSKLTWIIFTLLMLSLIIFYAYTYNPRKKRFGEEHGSAKFFDKALVLKKYSDKDYYKNRIISENIRISIIGRAIRLSLNTLVTGGMGEGKSYFTLIPNILQANTSFIITDPSKELFRQTASFLEKKGYKVKLLDLIDVSNSLRYNFFKYIKNEDDILRITDIIFESTVDAEKSVGMQDPMWENMAKFYLQALIGLIFYEGFESEKNIKTLIWAADKDTLQEDENGNRIPSVIMEKFKELESKRPGNFASSAYAAATDGEVATIRGVKSTFRGRIGKFLLPEIQALMASDDFELEKIGEEKTAVFLVVPSEDTRFNFIVSMWFAQAIPMLYETARKEKDNKLKIPVQFFIDEMPNFVMPKDFITYLTTGRKHLISFMMFVQELSQLEKMFPKNQNQVLIGTCNTFLYLGGSGYKTNEYISKWLDKETIASDSHSRSFGRNEHYSRNENLIARELLTTSEIDTKIGGDNCLVYVRGEGFCIDLKNNPKHHKNYRFLSDEELDIKGKYIAQAKIEVINNYVGKVDITIDIDKLNFEVYEGE